MNLISLPLTCENNELPMISNWCMLAIRFLSIDHMTRTKWPDRVVIELKDSVISVISVYGSQFICTNLNKLWLRKRIWDICKICRYCWYATVFSSLKHPIAIFNKILGCWPVYFLLWTLRPSKRYFDTMSKISYTTKVVRTIKCGIEIFHQLLSVNIPTTHSFSTHQNHSHQIIYICLVVYFLQALNCNKIVFYLFTRRFYKRHQWRRLASDSKIVYFHFWSASSGKFEYLWMFAFRLDVKRNDTCNARIGTK